MSLTGRKIRSIRRKLLHKETVPDEERIEFWLAVQDGRQNDPFGDPPFGSPSCVPIEYIDPFFGCRVEIVWKGDPDNENDTTLDYVDSGYLTCWPGHDGRDDWDTMGVVHVPNPDNPGGIGSSEGVWMTLYELERNPIIRRLIVGVRR